MGDPILNHPFWIGIVHKPSIFVGDPHDELESPIHVIISPLQGGAPHLCLLV